MLPERWWRNSQRSILSAKFGFAERMNGASKGRGILATLEKGLENLKALEDGVNMKNSTV